MILSRTLKKQLLQWRKNPRRKPLILRGARQVGKSFLVTQFAKEHYENCVVLNFEKEAAVRRLFQTQEEVKNILSQLEIMKNCSIHPEKTLLFFDEIQACPEAITKLRYFYEELPHYPLISAGSLLEFALDDEVHSFPVGRVEFLYLFPLTFEEYLENKGEEKLLQFLKGIKPLSGIPQAIHDQCNQHLKEYFLVGGMPEIVARFLESHRFMGVQTLMEGLLQNLKEDFRKYKTRFDPSHLEFIFEEIPKWVGRQVHFSKLGGTHLTSAQVSKGCQLINKAMLIAMAKATTSPHFPLTSKGKIHPKLFFLDIGLLQFQNRISEEILKSENLSSLYRGMLAEQFVHQEILALLGTTRKPETFFWVSEDRKQASEIDFIFPHRQYVIPVEVKAGKGTTLASLHQYNTRYHPPLSVRIYNGPLQWETIRVFLPSQKEIQYPLLSLPLYLTSELPRLMELYQTNG